MPEIPFQLIATAGEAASGAFGAFRRVITSGPGQIVTKGLAIGASGVAVGVGLGYGAHAVRVGIDAPTSSTYGHTLLNGVTPADIQQEKAAQDAKPPSLLGFLTSPTGFLVLAVVAGVALYFFARRK